MRFSLYNLSWDSKGLTGVLRLREVSAACHPRDASRGMADTQQQTFE